MAAITIPNKKDPIKLIVSVPQGNTFVLENNRESTYRVIARCSTDHDVNHFVTFFSIQINPLSAASIPPIKVADA